MLPYPASYVPELLTSFRGSTSFMYNVTMVYIVVKREICIFLAKPLAISYLLGFDMYQASNLFLTRIGGPNRIAFT